MPNEDLSPARATYRHGDLKRALLDAGVVLAREGGPAAVVLREATRRAGVVPNAAYRHFQNHQALLEAVRAVALSELARAIEAEIHATRWLRDPRQRARAAFRGVPDVRFELPDARAPATGDLRVGLGGSRGPRLRWSTDYSRGFGGEHRDEGWILGVWRAF